MMPFSRFRFFCPGYASMVRGANAILAGDHTEALFAFSKAHSSLKGATCVADIQNRARARHHFYSLFGAWWTEAHRDAEFGGSL